ncbi:RluA family pseudouridine synthase [Bacillus fonticola]|uniref:RluA family pseudouridine synthase n=1 Tax=Bacillus fonticola TaxID=2728853 RepID=UPI0014750DAB|nr:RluA family pseudouridine synthase [Bacillus fonticola]
MSTHKFTVDDQDAVSTRLDKYMKEQLPNVSRTQIQQWIQDGYILVNEKEIKTNYKVAFGDKIQVTEPRPVEIAMVPEDIPLDIKYEDEHLLVVNKPKGMVVHPSAGHTKGTLVHALLHHCKGSLSGINGELRPGIVHRIDKDTSGLLVVAKHDVAHQGLQDLLQDHQLKREYFAIAHGVIQHEKGTIDAPIARDTKDRQKMGVIDYGKPAVTHFEVVERVEGFTFVKCELETGRTHQIRVHFQYIGFPLAGDPKYGPKKTLALNGQALHAQRLSFVHPMTDELIECEAPLPSELAAVVEELKKH